MKTVQQQLQEKVNSALQSALEGATPEVTPDALQVVPCANPQFGDYQFNGALPLAKALRSNPRALAQNILAQLDVADMSETPEIAGPGFINFRLKQEFVERMTAEVLADTRLGVPLTTTPRRVVVDYSSPNVAKPMHVGHIRSTIIGAAIAQLLRFAGHEVITDNHIGDWGTAFGKIIVGWKRHENDADFEAQLQRDPIDCMERLYKEINAVTSNEDKDPTNGTPAGDLARAETAALQKGDAANRAIWERIRELSQREFDRVYERLGITFDETLGESFYNDRLGDVVRDLQARGIAQQSNGAVVVHFDTPPNLTDKPMMVQKSDGAANYATTDLATLQYRMERWHPQEILYVVGAPQNLHFQQLFETARRWGITDVQLRHIAFGSILGEDGRPFKTRSGESVKLRDLLDEAERRALEVVREKNPDLSPTQQTEVARVVGIGAVKYADLSQNRTSDYVFAWDKLLALNGNSAVYLEYAYVRIRSIFRKAKAEGLAADLEPLNALHLEHPAELELAKFILSFPLAIETALVDYRLNAISDYLFELAQKFTTFYSACPVVKSDEPLRSSRLALCELTANVLKQGLNLLGIETIEQM